MKSFFDPGAAEEINNRIENLKATSQRVWGKMEVAQMLAHCSASLEVATGKKNLPRLFIGRILGPFVKSSYLGEKPMGKNSPTDKSFIINDPREFDTEKLKLKKLVAEFANGGEAKCTRHPHSFFGKLTPAEWGKAMYKHMNHHLVQFGV